MLVCSFVALVELFSTFIFVDLYFVFLFCSRTCCCKLRIANWCHHKECIRAANDPTPAKCSIQLLPLKSYFFRWLYCSMCLMALLILLDVRLRALTFAHQQRLILIIMNAWHMQSVTTITSTMTLLLVIFFTCYAFSRIAIRET